MNGTAPRLETLYAAALRDHLAHAGEATLQRAYEIGRRAIAEDRGLLELVALHHEVLETCLPRGVAADSCAEAHRIAAAFLAESLASYEMTHRGFREGVAVLRRLNEALEEEARRIAHALHDDAGQLLASVHLRLDESARDLGPKARSRLATVHGALDQIEEHLRRISHELRPTVLDDLGLLPALELLAQGISTRSGITVAVDGTRNRRLPPRIETALYRVVQEAVRNATRHGGARRVDVRLVVEAGGVRCSVRDDGRGFDPAAVGRRGGCGLGLIGMRERLDALGGGLTIDSAPGRGAEVRITIPLEEHHADTSSAGR